MPITVMLGHCWPTRRDEDASYLGYLDSSLRHWAHLMVSDRTRPHPGSDLQVGMLRMVDAA